MNERITDIEIQLMHQENFMQQLNEVVTMQQQALEKLQTDIKQIKEQLQMIAPSVVRNASEEEPPPHY